jgi:hypothetical protein
MPEGLSSEKKLEQFLTHLARDRDVSASTQNQALNAILFFYREVLGQTIGNVNALRANRPVHERHAPTVSETQLLLQTIRNEGGYLGHPLLLRNSAPNILESDANLHFSDWHFISDNVFYQSHLRKQREGWNSLLSYLLQEKAPIRPVRITLKLPQVAEGPGHSADVILRDAFLIDENEPTVIDSLLAPRAQQRRNRPQVERKERHLLASRLAQNLPIGCADEVAIHPFEEGRDWDASTKPSGSHSHLGRNLLVGEDGEHRLFLAF